MQRSKNIEQYFLILAIAGFFFAVMGAFINVLLVGLLMALVLNPFMVWVSKTLRQGPKRSAALVTLVLAICVVLPVSYTTVIVAQDATQLTHTIAGWDPISGIPFFQNEAPPESSSVSPNPAPELSRLGKLKEKIAHLLPFETSELKKNLVNILSTTAKGVAIALATFAATFVKFLPVALLSIVIFILTLFFALAEGPALGNFIKSLLPYDDDDKEILSKTVIDISRGVVLGSLFTGLVQGIIIGSAYSFLGVPRALFFANLTLIFSFIPFVGSGPTGLGGAIYLFANGRTGAAVAMLGAFALASVADNVIRPLMLKGNARLHPLLALLSVMGGIAFFGMSGLFLGPLFVALMLAGLQIFKRSSKA